MRGMGRAALCLLCVAGAVSPAPAVAAGAVEVIDTTSNGRAPCPPIAMLGPFEAQEGCVIKAVSGDIDFSVATAVGAFDFGRCGIYYTLHVDGRGRTVLEDMGVLGKSPCPDSSPCFRGDRKGEVEYPWKGRIEATSDGGFVHRMDACLDTCLGRFRGVLKMDLDQERPGQWRARTGRGAVGASGWQLGEGTWAWRHTSDDPSERSRRETGIAIRRAGSTGG